MFTYITSWRVNMFTYITSWRVNMFAYITSWRVNMFAYINNWNVNIFVYTIVSSPDQRLCRMFSSLGITSSVCLLFTFESSPMPILVILFTSFLFSCSQRVLNYLAFKTSGFRCTWWRLFHKRLVRT